MITYYDYITENEGPKLDGKYGFFMFLKLIDDLKMNFIKTNHFLNVGKYQYFFTTEHVRKKEEFLGYFIESLSLKTTCETAQKLKNERISFYFGIKNNQLEYGFQDDMKRDIYKTGVFEVNTKYVRSLKSYKCLSLIEGILKNSNLVNLNLLQEIKIHLKGLYGGKGKVLILNEEVVAKKIEKDEIKDDVKDSIKLLQKYEQWCLKFKWVNKVDYYIDNEEDLETTFYVKIKTRKDDQEL